MSHPHSLRRPIHRATSSLEALESRIAPAALMVTNNQDTGPGSLRAALLNSASGDTIAFAPSLSGQTILLTSGTLIVNHSVQISGLGENLLTIDGNDSSAIFNLIGQGSAVAIDHLSLVHGHGVNGGAISALDGSLALDHVILDQNAATGEGGAVYFSSEGGTLAITNSAVTNNTAGDDGGGIYSLAPTVTIDQTTIADNRAGQADVSDAAGGLFANFVTGSFTLTASTVSGNSAYAVGAVEVLGSSGASLLIQNSTVAANHATLYSGIYLDGFGANVSSFANGLAASTGAKIANSTIAGNTASGGAEGGLYLASGDLDIVRSILAGNTAGGAGRDLSLGTGTINVRDSLVQNPDAGSITGTSTHNIFGQDPSLLALANNGGPTKTMALAASSVALDQGSNGDGLLYDQRGLGFARTGGSGTDIGAFEFQPVLDLALTKTADVSSVTPGDAAHSTITYTFHLNNHGTLDATGVSVSDPVVAGLTFVAGENPTWAFDTNTQAYVHAAGSVAAGASVTDFKLILHAAATVSADTDTLTNTATVSDDQTHGADATPSDNTSSASVDVNADATLHVSVVSDIATEVAHGGTIHYTLTFSNTGNRDAAATLSEQIDSFTSASLLENPSWTFNPATASYEFHVANLAAGAPAQTVGFTVHASTSVPTFITRLTDNVSIDYADGSESVGNASTDTHASVQTPIYQGIYVTSPGVSTPGHYAPPIIHVHDISLNTDQSFTVYAKTVKDSIRTTVGDFNGDGFDDILITTEHGVGATKVIDGRTGEPVLSALNNLQPFGKNKGSFVAVGVVSTFQFVPNLELPNLISSPDAVFGSSLGGGMVKIYNSQPNILFSPSITTVTLTQQIGPTLYPFGKTFKGGVRVAFGDVDGDGTNDLVVAEGNFGGMVRVYDGKTLASEQPSTLAMFQVGGARYRGGLNLAVGDLDGDDKAEIVTGRNSRSAPTVDVFSYSRANGDAPVVFLPKGSFNAFAATYKQGVRVALADVNNDGTLDILAAPGYAGKSKVNIFDGAFFNGKTLTTTFTAPPVPKLLDTYTAFAANASQAVWVAGTIEVPAIVNILQGGLL